MDISMDVRIPYNMWLYPSHLFHTLSYQGLRYFIHETSGIIHINPRKTMIKEEADIYDKQKNDVIYLFQGNCPKIFIAQVFTLPLNTYKFPCFKHWHLTHTFAPYTIIFKLRWKVHYMGISNLDTKARTLRPSSIVNLSENKHTLHSPLSPVWLILL